jgi:uncharacterized protein YmfQ (DUF2313 family)
MKRVYWILYISTALLLTAPALSRAHLPDESRGAEWLQEHLYPGRNPESYRRMLRDLGYSITVNGRTPDYVEYDIARGDEAYRVKIGVDPDTGKAAEINVVPQDGETTETAMEHGRGVEWLQERLRPGRNREYYRRVLRDLGYSITVNGNTPDYVEYDIMKRNRAYRVKIGIDPDTGEAVEINVVPESMETARARREYFSR